MTGRPLSALGFLQIYRNSRNFRQGGSYTFESGLALLIYYSTYTRSLGGPESIMSCMMLSGLPRLVGGSSFFFILFSLLSRSLGGLESIMSHMMLSSLPRLVCALLHLFLGGPESIMSCMMLSGLPRLEGGLQSSSIKFRILHCKTL